MIHEKQLMYYHRIHNNNKCQTTDIATNPKNPWNLQMKKLLTKYGGGVTQDVGSGTIGVKKCGKWDYRGEKMWEVGLSL